MADAALDRPAAKGKKKNQSSPFLDHIFFQRSRSTWPTHKVSWRVCLLLGLLLLRYFNKKAAITARYLTLTA